MMPTDLEIPNLVSLNHDGAKFYILISHNDGRMLSKALPRKVCETIVEQFHLKMKQKHPQLNYEIKIVSKRDNESVYALVK